MNSKNKGKDFCMFALPGMFCFFAVVIIPFLYGVYLTFTDWNGVSKEKNFIWFENFKGVVSDKEFWTSLLLTFKYVIVVVVLIVKIKASAQLFADRCAYSLLGRGEIVFWASK